LHSFLDVVTDSLPVRLPSIFGVRVPHVPRKRRLEKLRPNSKLLDFTLHSSRPLTVLPK
jgi:hypothetical protein